MSQPSPQFLTAPNGDRIAYIAHQQSSTRPGVMFCGGFMSDMEGSKALALQDHCAANGLNFVRFDYHGHGASDGVFAEGTISRWTTSALAVLDQLTHGPQIVIGSSMGGWIALRLILQRAGRIKGMIGIAAAPDFVDRMWKDELSEEARQAIMKQGYVDIPSDYGPDPYRFTKDLIMDGRASRVLNRLHGITCPVRLIQGLEDPDVPWPTALDLADRLVNSDVDLTLVPGGDHRLSEPTDIARLLRTLDGLVAEVEQG